MENILFILFFLQKLGRQMLSLWDAWWLYISLCPSQSLFSPFLAFLFFLFLLGLTSYKSLCRFVMEITHSFGITQFIPLQTIITWKWPSDCALSRYVRELPVPRLPCCEEPNPPREVRCWCSNQQSWFSPASPCQTSEPWGVKWFQSPAVKPHPAFESSQPKMWRTGQLRPFQISDPQNPWM